MGFAVFLSNDHLPISYSCEGRINAQIFIRPKFSVTVTLKVMHMTLSNFLLHCFPPTFF